MHFVLFVMVLVCCCFRCNFQSCDFVSGKMKGIHYEPTAIGENPISDRIDLYTNLYGNRHKSSISQIKALGATHVIVGPIWNICNTGCHSMFLEELNKYELSLVITLDGAGDADNSQIIIKNAQTMENEASSVLGNRFAGFFVPALSFLSSNSQWSYFYVSFMPSLVTASSCILTEFPINGDGTTIDHIDPSVPVSAWSLNLYPGLADSYLKTFQKTFNEDMKVVPVIHAADYDPLLQQANQSLQASSIYDLIRTVSKKPSPFIGSIYFEFSDGWWRSSAVEAESGADSMYKCPSWNSYSHSPCAKGLSSSNVYLGWLGLYSISSHPFQICLHKKKAAEIIKQFWSSQALLQDLIYAYEELLFWLAIPIDYPKDLWIMIVSFLVPFAVLLLVFMIPWLLYSRIQTREKTQ